MLRSENFGFRLSRGEKALLLLVSEKEERTASDVLRRLIREEARRYGLWPPPNEHVQAQAAAQLNYNGGDK
jgi:hypothetical protein